MSKYFKEAELKCSHCDEYVFNAEFLNILNRVRSLFNKPIYITSGYRCKEHNKAVGGKANSAHTKGLAVDIKCENSLDRYHLMRIFLDLGINRIGVGSDFLHIDVSENLPSPRMWTY